MRLSLPSLRRPRLNSVGLINAALAVAAVGGGLWAYQIVSGPAVAEASQTSTRTRVVAVTQGTVSQTVSASGSVASAATANANFTTSGTVTEVGVKVGDVVTKGQVLAKVDPTAAQASLNTAKANLTAAKAALTRAENNSADDATIASAEAQVATAQASVTSAQTTVNGTVLTAPIAGTVTAVNGAVGSSSSGSSSSTGSTGATGSTGGSSSGFIQLADLTKLQINASFAEADATKLKAGQAAEISWSALSGTRATGKVGTISPTATTSNNVNSYAVVIGLETLPEGVRLGQSTTAVVTIAEAQDAIRIPTAALRTAGGQRTVQVQVNGQVETRTVEVGITGGSFVEIKSGLTAGEQVVITTTTTNSTTGTTNNQQFPGGGLTGGGGGFTGGGGTRPGN